MLKFTSEFASDALIDIAGDAIRDGDFNRLDNMFASLEVNNISVPMGLALISLTESVNRYTPHRAVFIQKLREHLEIIDPEKAVKLSHRLVK